MIGKIVTYNMEERQRVKIVDYTGSKKIEMSKIDEKLKEPNCEIRLDTFIDPGLVAQGRRASCGHDEGEGLPGRATSRPRSRRCRAARSSCT